jgi:hypothetical protein
MQVDAILAEPTEQPCKVRPHRLDPLPLDRIPRPSADDERKVKDQMPRDRLGLRVAHQVLRQRNQIEFRNRRHQDLVPVLPRVRRKEPFQRFDH